MEKYVGALIVSFFIYGFCGWIWESFICPIITKNKMKNSGFLNGPIVPIYGVGAIVVSLLFSYHESYLSIFIEGAFVACVIEYFTSWAMEAMYHHRWWDYSDKAFNVNGRVCLEGFGVFGLFSVIAVKFVQPTIMSWLLQYNSIFLIVTATFLTTILFIDLIFTVIALIHLEERLDIFVKIIEEYASKAFEGLEAGRQNIYDIIEDMNVKDSPIYQEFIKQTKFVEKRIIKAFPHLMKKKK
ncbi:putative ABC transporter permease [Candidatus Stoquefichus massiliensis]|uniref:putative ABC transporter permease n=1 Tax=Candidatus Stoquefichus massiliensis TaxID=1470350 RepID=UPI0004899F54|nr:putative ABC transporter permease [Candidatus Stoquefichus massiliensis]